MANGGFGEVFLKDKTIVCYSGTNWKLPWGISQKIMRKLSQRNRVLFIEYQPSLAHCCLRSLSHIEYKPGNRGKFKEEDANLYLYSPPVGLPFNNYFRFVNMLNQREIVRDIKDELKEYNSGDVIIWAFVPSAVDFIKELGSFFTIYHCLGDYSKEKANPLRRRTVSGMERELIRRTDIIVAQTASLCSRFNAMGKRTFYFPSAVDIDRFSTDSRRAEDAAFEFSRIKHPRIGVVGYFDDSFYDVKLLEYLMKAKRDWSFVFIGPLTGKARRFASLRKNGNAFFLGYKNPEDIPSRIRELDVGIIPYKDTDYIKEVSPTKFYEYMVCGKPVVSTELPDIKGCSVAVKTARAKDEFLKYIEVFLELGDKESLVKEAMLVAKENSLDRYLKGLSETIAGLQGG